MTQIKATGQNAIGTSAEKVVATDQKCSSLILRSLATNTALIYVGVDANVTSSTGLPLSPGDYVVWPAENTQTVYAIAASGSQTLAFAIESRP